MLKTESDTERDRERDRDRAVLRASTLSLYAKNQKILKNIKFRKTLKNSFKAHFGTFWPENLKTGFSPQKLFGSILRLREKIRKIRCPNFSKKLKNPHFVWV